MKSSNILTRLGKYSRPAKRKQCEVVFSSRAYAALLSEVLSEIQTETGGVFLGYYDDGVWQVVESIDPGPNSIFEVAYFEYDQDYINHLINKVSRIYGRQLDLIGLWHRHPGSFDQFSSTDDGTNTNYAELTSYGAISALVNIDPGFRLTVYHVTTNPLRYREVNYKVLTRDEDPIQAAYAECTTRLNQINTIANGASVNGAANENGVYELNPSDVVYALHSFLDSRNIAGMVNRSIGTAETWSDAEFDYVLTAIEKDAAFLEGLGISLVARLSENKSLELNLEREDTVTSLIDAIEPFEDGRIFFNCDGKSYQYHPGLIREAIEEKRAHAIV